MIHNTAFCLLCTAATIEGHRKNSSSQPKYPIPKKKSTQLDDAHLWDRTSQEWTPRSKNKFNANWRRNRETWGGKLLPQGRRKKLRFSLPPTILCSCLGHMVRSSKYSNTRQKYNQPLISSIELSICQEGRQPGSFFTTQKNEELNCLPADATSLLREHCGLSSQFQK